MKLTTLTLFLLVLFFNGCSVFQEIRTADRSRLNSPLMSSDLFSDLATVSPLTGLRSSNAQSGGGCSSCAH